MVDGTKLRARRIANLQIRCHSLRDTISVNLTDNMEGWVQGKFDSGKTRGRIRCLIPSGLDRPGLDPGIGHAIPQEAPEATLAAVLVMLERT